MSRRLTLAFATAVALATASLPAWAQSAGVRPVRGARVQSHRMTGHFKGARLHSNRLSSNFQRHVFVPGFGLRPVIRERFPVFGLGFDAHHFHAVKRHHGFQGGFFGGGFFGNNFFGGGFFPFGGFSSSSVVVVPQVIPVQPQFIPVQVPVPMVVQDLGQLVKDVVVPLGLPSNWSQLRIAKPSYATDRPPLRQLTLLVLKDQTIYAATDYWLEDGRIFYVTSTGRQGSVPVRDLDWETTTHLNAERRVTFVLRSAR